MGDGNSDSPAGMKPKFRSDSSLVLNTRCKVHILVITVKKCTAAFQKYSFKVPCSVIRLTWEMNRQCLGDAQCLACAGWLILRKMESQIMISWVQTHGTTDRLRVSWKALKKKNTCRHGRGQRKTGETYVGINAWWKRKEKICCKEFGEVCSSTTLNN